MKLCRCGAIVRGKCERCYPPQQHNKTTAQRGYDNRWRKLSELKRTKDPLCEQCLEEGRTTPATEVHHIKPIAEHPELRLVWANLMSVCRECHDRLEPGRKKEWQLKD